MAKTDANKSNFKKSRKKPAEPETVAEARVRESSPGYWKLTDDEVLLRSPEPEDEYKTSDSWRVFRIMSEFVSGFDDLATITRGVTIFGSARTAEGDEMYEAAELDGASWWGRFVHITLPSLAPTFLFVGIITMLGQFQLFAEPYVMTQGGPLKATTGVVLLMYEEGFRWWRIGLAAAIAFVLFVIMLLGTLIQLRVQRERGA